ncbi:MAG: hypothetical protein MHMPM18_001968 [Marteilia pararefringens]
MERLAMIQLRHTVLFILRNDSTLLAFHIFDEEHNKLISSLGEFRVLMYAFTMIDEIRYRAKKFPNDDFILDVGLNIRDLGGTVKFMHKGKHLQLLILHPRNDQITDESKIILLNAIASLLPNDDDEEEIESYMDGNFLGKLEKLLQN